MLSRAVFFTCLLLLAACGGSNDETATADGNDVGTKAVADVDAAMAETLRAEAAPAAALPSAAAPAN